MNTQAFRKPMILKIILLFVATILISSTRTHADVTIGRSVGPILDGDITIDDVIYNWIDIRITNKITQKDAADIANHLSDFDNASVGVYLNSVGGDVYAAMQIGRIMRKYDAGMAVEGKCYSSCVLIFIAGVERHNFGVIGLHRPYFVSAPHNREEIERQAPLMLQKLKTYVQEMGITENFYQEMVNTEPSDIKLYTSDKIKGMVPVYDPTYDEVQISYQARKYGLDTAEMRKRNFDSQQQCQTVQTKSKFSEFPDAPWICRAAQKWGLSISVYEQRRDKTVKCKLSNEEISTLNLTKINEKRDHPFYLKWENCVRNIMLGQ
jgi:ATP-dependent protease ClpP protease subunit